MTVEIFLFNFLKERCFRNILRTYVTYILSKKFDSIRILVLFDIRKIWKNHPYRRCQEHLFCIIIIPKSYWQIDEQNNCSINNQVAYHFFHFKWIDWFFRIHLNILNSFFTFLKILFLKKFCYKTSKILNITLIFKNV